MELTLAIAQYLSPVAHLVMQHVCIKFRTGFASDLEGNTLTVKELLQFAFLLQRDLQLRLQDDYNRKCNLAPLNSIFDRFGCSGCRTIHGMENFSAKQLSLLPNTRICKGLEGTFRLCSHLSFSGECLLRGLRQLQNAELFCQVRHREDIHGKDMTCVRGRQSGPRVGFHGGHTITMDRVIPF